MWPRYLIVSNIILFLAVAGLSVNWLFPNKELGNVATVLLYGANIMAVNYLYRFGRFAYTRWRRILFLLIAIGFVGLLLRFSHWPYAQLIITLPNLGIPVIYTIWFFRKREQTTNDFLKAVWIIIHFTATWLEQLHFFSAGIYTAIVSTLLLQFTYIQFWVILNDKLMQKEDDWDFERGIKG